MGGVHRVGIPVGRLAQSDDRVMPDKCTIRIICLYVGGIGLCQLGMPVVGDIKI